MKIGMSEQILHEVVTTFPLYECINGTDIVSDWYCKTMHIIPPKGQS